MKKMMVFGGLAILAVGCIGPKRFQYKIEEQGVVRCGTQFQDVSLVVHPLIDDRMDKSSTEGWSLLVYLPLLPYMPYHNYDLSHFSADTGELKFNAEADLGNAVIEHLKYDGLANVSSVVVRSPKWRQYELDVNIKALGVDGYRTLYCLGLIPGCYLVMFGAPFNYAESKLVMSFTLRNPEGKVVLDKTYEASRSYCVGEYYNWNPFKHVGHNLASIMNRSCRDMAQAIADDCPNAQLTRRIYVPLK